MPKMDVYVRMKCPVIKIKVIRRSVMGAGLKTSRVFANAVCVPG